MTIGAVLIHLRIPFSFFLLPIALLGLVVAGSLDAGRTIALLVIIHLGVYTASNAFNSYYDRDEGPVGGIRLPPKVGPPLLYTSLIVEFLSIVAGFLVAWPVGLGLLVYGFFSKGYSWDRTRWKRKPFFSLFGIALVQGALVFGLVALCAGSDAPLAGPGLLRPIDQIGHDIVGRLPQLLSGAACTVAFLLAVYPLTQVYQHEADAARGDLTFSRVVGIQGTFRWSALCMLVTGGAFGAYAALTWGPKAWLPLGILALALAPALVFFGRWWLRVSRDPTKADFSHTMIMNGLASAGMNAGLITLLFIANEAVLR